MASEKRGAIAEALTEIALRRILGRLTSLGKLWLQTPPPGVSIDSDFSIGPSPDHPTVVVLVTVSGSIKDSTRKFWRNMAELVELKVLPKAPKVISVAFTDFAKNGIAAVEAATVDVVLLVAANAPQLSSFADKQQSKAPKRYEEVLAWVESHLRRDARLAAGVTWLETELEKAISTSVPKVARIWQLESKRRAAGTAALDPRTTSFKKGLGRLLLFPEWPAVLRDKGRRIVGPNAEVGLALGLCRGSIAGTKLTDPDVHWTLDNFDAALLERIVRAQPLARLEGWLQALREQSHLKKQADWILDHWAALCEPSGLFAALRKCKADPASVAPGLARRGSVRVWIFHVLLDLLKLAAGGTQAFGAAALQADLAALEDRREHRAVVKKLLKTEPSWRRGRTIWLGLADWSNGPSAQNFRLYDDDLARVVDALCRRMSGVDPNILRGRMQELQRVQFTSTFDGKVMSHQFDPLRSLVLETLKGQGLPQKECSLSSCFADRVRQGIATIDPRTAGTEVVLSKHTVVASQTMTKQGRDHKRKEFASRAVSVRYAWSDKGFIERRGINKLILVLDGEIGSRELDVLRTAGWDEIFYPDEMNKLVKAIV